MQQVISTQDVHLSNRNAYETSSYLTTGMIHKFINWCDMQETNRFLWLGVALMAGIGTVLPLTLSAIVFIGGNSLLLWIMALVFNVPVLIVNLAAQPTKLTLPVLFSAWVVNAFIIIYSLVNFFVR